MYLIESCCVFLVLYVLVQIGYLYNLSLVRLTLTYHCSVAVGNTVPTLVLGVIASTVISDPPFDLYRS